MGRALCTVEFRASDVAFGVTETREPGSSRIKPNFFLAPWAVGAVHENIAVRGEANARWGRKRSSGQLAPALIPASSVTRSLYCITMFEICLLLYLLTKPHRQSAEERVQAPLRCAKPSFACDTQSERPKTRASKCDNAKRTKCNSVNVYKFCGV